MTAEERFKEAIEKYIVDQNNMDKEYSRPVYNATDIFRSTLAQEMYNVYRAGWSAGIGEATNIVHDVMDHTIREALKKNPKMSLKDFAKKYGIEEQ